MNTLSKDWFSDGLIDFEYKKYILLAYLKKVHEEFDKTSLYPSLGDVLFHYRNIKSYIENKNKLADSFPKELSKADILKLKLIYKRVIHDSDVLDELQQISEYAFAQFEQALATGTEIYDFAESQLSVEPIGISPMYHNEGYVFTLLPPGKQLNVYSYKIALFENESESFRGLHLNFIETKPYSISTTLENIKIEIVKRYKILPNPATYAIISSMKFPYESTFLPIAKRMLIKRIAA